MTAKEKTMRKPKFKHDCETCQYLATIHVTGMEDQPEADHIYDLYYCPQSSSPTVIARYGDEPEDYSSGIGFAGLNPVIAFAVVAARRLRLLKKEVIKNV